MTQRRRDWLVVCGLATGLLVAPALAQGPPGKPPEPVPVGHWQPPPDPTACFDTEWFWTVVQSAHSEDWRAEGEYEEYSGTAVLYPLHPVGPEGSWGFLEIRAENSRGEDRKDNDEVALLKVTIN